MRRKKSKEIGEDQKNKKDGKDLREGKKKEVKEDQKKKEDSENNEDR